MESGMQKQDVTAFKCRDCGYIHTKNDNTKPKKCIDCNGTSFRQVDDDATNRTNTSSIGQNIGEIIEEASLSGVVFYLIFILILIIGTCGTLYLLLI